jgi:hypothetical protein
MFKNSPHSLNKILYPQEAAKGSTPLEASLIEKIGRAIVFMQAKRKSIANYL